LIERDLAIEVMQRGNAHKSATSAGLYFNFNLAPAITPSASRKESEKGTRKMTAKVTVADVERVAELANLELELDESRSMVHDLNAILDHVAQLNELDTTGVMPLAQVNELGGAAGPAVLRPDTVIASLDRAVVMPQAPDTDGIFFRVPKVIER
jgi:aspartyl-tRNA(Asn)/glutamyl-tRNA(Gln) amidotransferase subunit C